VAEQRQALPEIPEDALPALVNRWPEGTELESLCPECLRTGSKGGIVIDKVWCWWCLVEDNEFIRVVWRRLHH